MKNYFKILDGYPQTYQGKAPLDDTWKEFEVATDEVTGLSLYYPVELNDAIVALEAKEAEEKAYAEAKQAKQELLDTIVVTTASGKKFDGRDIDQTRMMAAIQAADILGQTTTEWKLADNSIATVTVDEVKEALALAIQKTGEIIKG